MKHCLTVAFSLFVISAQVQSQELSHHKIQAVPFGTTTFWEGESRNYPQYPVSFDSQYKKDQLHWVFRHNEVPSGKLKLVIPFPLFVYRTRDEKIEVAFLVTPSNKIFLTRFLF